MACSRNKKNSLLPPLVDAIREINMDVMQLPPLEHAQTESHPSSSLLASVGITSPSTGKHSPPGSSSANVTGPSTSSKQKKMAFSEKLTCPTCQKTFQRPSDTTKHTKTVHGPKKFRCVVCKQMFARRDYKEVCFSDFHLCALV